MTAMSSVSRPVSLVVEDDPTLLRRSTDLMNAVGFHAIGVRSYQDAVREFRSGPTIDLVVTDINLDPHQRDDRSGVTLARELHALAPRLPIVGYSAVFAENDLMPSDVALFTEYVPKGRTRPEELAQRVDDWFNLALEYRNLRGALVREELERLRRLYSIRERDFEILRSFVPGFTAQGATPADDEEPQGADDLLRKAGYRLRLIEAGAPRPRIANPESRVIAPIPVWVRRDDSATVVEVAGFAELYQYGVNEDAAIRELLLLMDGIYQDLANDARKNSPRMESLYDFLRRVFG